MTGSGVENDKKVEVRITLRLGPNEYHCLRETRLPGPAFQMRDAYNFTRRDPPLGAAHRDDFRIPSRSLTLVKEIRFGSAVPRMPTPIDQRKKPVAVKIHVKTSAGVDITWADGHSSHFDFSFLRENCPCATCNDERAKKESSHVGPRLSSPLLPMYKPKPRAQSASPVGNYAIQISFSDGHSTGIFSYDYLRTQCPCEECARAFRAPAATK